MIRTAGRESTKRLGHARRMFGDEIESQRLDGDQRVA
jgi:hypothetical protein